MLVLGLALGGCGTRTELRAGEPGRGVAGGVGGSVAEPVPSPMPGRCTRPSFDYASEPATVLLLVDRSGSMTAPFGSATRWSVVREALFGERDGLVARLGDTTRFGLAFYTSLDGFLGGTCPMMEGSAPVLGDPAALSQAFDSTSPLTDGDTPTGEALYEALAWFDLYDASGPLYLVLITDGEPDTCSEPDPQNGQAEALDAARGVFERGIALYVVGVSSDVGEAHLQHMANVGQGVRATAQWGRDSEAIRPIVASDQDNALAGQIQGALGDLRSCTIGLDEGVDLEGAFVVTLDGQQVPPSEYDVADGQLVLFGETCVRVLGDAKTLEVEVPCRN